MAAENKANQNQGMLLWMAMTVMVLATSLGVFGCNRTDSNPSGSLEKITIACATLPETALAQVAQARGYYRAEGLEATARLHPYGKRALEDLQAGGADFATVAETPVMFATMKGEKLAVIATIETSNLGHAVVARKDRGIRSLGDLKGKRIATTLGTSADFFLDAITGVQGFSRNEIEVVDLKAQEIPDALARGDIDAVSTFTPYVAYAQKKLGELATTFSDKEVYTYHFNVVTTQEFIRQNPVKVKKLLRALVRAEEFVLRNPGEAQKIVSDFSGIEIGIVHSTWADARFEVTLNETLILALEDESRWAMKRGLATNKEVPNYLNFIYFDGLKAIKPEAVGILK